MRPLRSMSPSPCNGAFAAPIYTRRALPGVRRQRNRSRAGTRFGLRAAAIGAIATSVAVPLLRKRLRIPAKATVAATVAGPLGTAILKRRTKTRDAILFAQQMWAFTVVHELPYDDPEALRRRLKVRYPIATDRIIGLGRLPNWRLQKAFARPEGPTRFDRLLAFAHWAWFFEPHASLLFILIRDNENFARAARQMAAAYDLGCVTYFAVPTAPPWWASEHGYTGDEEVRRLMIPVGEQVWKGAWPRLYESLGGNPWAAMPSLHFGASVLAAMLLSESSRTAGAVGWAYAGVLGLALVHLGEHYVTDLLAGLALVGIVRKGEPLAEPFALALSDALQRLEHRAGASGAGSG